MTIYVVSRSNGNGWEVQAAYTLYSNAWADAQSGEDNNPGYEYRITETCLLETRLSEALKA
jgi:hypothetical protein